MINKSKILLFLICLFFSVDTAFCQLSMISTTDNSTWQQLFNPPSNQVLYQYPGALCACKMFTDPAPSGLYAQLPSLFVEDSNSDFVWQYWDTNAEDFGFLRYSSQFSVPRGIVAFSNGDMYVADTNNNRIVKLNYNANNVTFVSQNGSAGTSIGQFNFPCEMTSDAEGNIYVADVANSRIQKFDRNLNPLNVFPDNRGAPEAGTTPVNFLGGYASVNSGMFLGPQGVAIDLVDDDIYVADTGNQRIEHFSKSGAFINAVNLKNSTLPGISSNPVITYMDVDQKEHLYVVDQSNDTLYVFDNNLNYLFPSTGNPLSPFVHLQGVAVEKSQDSSGNNFTHGDIYVSDQGRVQTFGIDFAITNLTAPSSVYEGPTNACPIPVTITYTLSGSANVTAVILAGNSATPLATLLNNQTQGIGNQQVVWNGEVNGSNIASPGTYTIGIEGQDSGGNVGVASDGINVVLDNTPPTTSVSFNGNQYLDTTASPNELFVQKGDVFNITATDSQSGVSQTSYGLDTSSLTVGTTGTVPSTWADGLHNLYMQSMDNVCNTASVTQQMFIDTTPPLNHISITGSGCSNDGQIPDTATAISSEGQNIVAFIPQDPGVYPSGVSIGEYSINGGSYQVDNGTNFQNATSQIGTYEVNLFSVDNMGNQSAVRHISDIRLPVLPALAATSGQVDFLNSSVTVDSYNSSNPYGPSNSFSNGNVQAAGSIVENGNPVIKGTLCQDCSINYPLIAVPRDAVNLGTELLNGPTTLTAGDYVASSFTVNGGASLVGIGGQVRIWVTGTISIDSNVTAYNNHTDNIWFIGGANTNVNINGGTTIIGTIYAPDSQINVNYTVFGSIVGSQVNVNGGGAVHKDDYSSCSNGNGTPTPTFTPTISPTAISTICPYTVTTQWGGSGTVNGTFSDPEGVAVDQNHNVYVADTDNSMVEKFDSNGNYLTKWSGGVTALNNPEGIATDSVGNVYVADTGNNIIQVFNSNGVFLRQFGGSGLGSGKFDSPVGLAVYTSGCIFRSKAATRFGPIRPPISEQNGHLFRSNPATFAG